MTHYDAYTWRCRLCGAAVVLNLSIHPEQTVSYRNEDGSIRSWATATAALSGMEHTCPPGTLAPVEKQGS